MKLKTIWPATKRKNASGNLFAAPSALGARLPETSKPVDGLCMNEKDIYLNHRYGPGWVCKRCGFKVDLQKLIGQ